MSNEDAAVTPPVMAGSTISAEEDLRLTPEQRAFAEVIGPRIATFWSEAHDEMRVRQPRSHDAQPSAGTTDGQTAGRD
jgi:hypothetical protein